MAHLIPHLSEDDLIALDVKVGDVTDMLEQLIKGAQADRVWSAPKAVITTPDGRYIMATLATMDIVEGDMKEAGIKNTGQNASSGPSSFVATKSLVLNAKNSDIGLPQINSLVTLLNGHTGVPLAIMDGNWVTAIRTAGLSALAAKYMAKPDAKSVGFVGTGVQARSHLKLFSEMFPLESVKIFGRGQKNIDLLSKEAKKFGLAVEICAEPRQAVENVDLVVTSMTHTSVKEPFLDADWLAKGCHLSSVDLGVPWFKHSFKSLDQIVIDDLEQEMTLPNKLVDANDISGDLASLVTGLVGNESQARSNLEARTAFVFRGHALGDLALSVLAYIKYRGSD